MEGYHLDKILGFIEENQIRQAINLLREYATESNSQEIQTNFITVSSLYSAFESDRLKGILSLEQQDVKFAIIKHKIIQLSYQIQSHIQESQQFPAKEENRRLPFNFITVLSSLLVVIIIAVSAFFLPDLFINSGNTESTPIQEDSIVISNETKQSEKPAKNQPDVSTQKEELQNDESIETNLPKRKPVAKQAKLKLANPSIRFDAIRQEDKASQTQSIYIENQGNATAENIHISSNSLQLISPTSPFDLSPKQKIQLQFELNPQNLTKIGNYSEKMMVVCDDISFSQEIIWSIKVLPIKVKCTIQEAVNCLISFTDKFQGKRVEIHTNHNGLAEYEIAKELKGESVKVKYSCNGSSQNEQMIRIGRDDGCIVLPIRNN